MNLLFFCQSRSLDVFYQMMLRVKKNHTVERVGFYVANLLHYEEFLASHPGFENKFDVVKEWEIYQAADGHTADLERIAKYENEIGDPFLWSPIVTDRRLFLGKRSSFHQDYHSRFSQDERLAILDIALQQIDGLFQRVQPDAVATVYTATFGDCLGHQLAQARGIKSLDLRLARLKNYVMFADGVSEPPPHIVKIYDAMQSGIPEAIQKEAEEYVESVVKTHAMYEGVQPSKERQKTVEKASTSPSPSPTKRIGELWGAFQQYRKMQRAPYKYDLQQQDVLQHSLYSRFINPLNVKKTKKALHGRMVYKDDLPSMNYILYPLHVEPETVISQFGRPYLNQIELIRNISLSIPVGMTLLVKDHPMMVSRRSLGYYEKILEIPNVRLADLDLASESVLQHTKMVAIIRGAIGLEAVMKQIPVVCMGKALFDLLPDCMFRSCYNLYELPDVIRDLLQNYRYDHDALIRYLSAVIQGSAQANLVTDLLGKKGRFRTDVDGAEQAFEEHSHLDVLTGYFLERIGISNNPK